MEEAATGDVVNVKQAIIDKYGFEPPDVYCVDLIKFLNVLRPLIEEEEPDPEPAEFLGDDHVFYVTDVDSLVDSLVPFTEGSSDVTGK